MHLGKHGTLEWLPGKGLGLSAGCAPDAVLGHLPLIYPFIVNDPGEGTQAKRRGHATIIDHLIPPMARADSYGDLARLEQLLDEYATVSALDPAKLPVLRTQIWELIQAAELHHDLELAAAPGEEEFDSFVLHVDGYLCEVKDALIRDGLHILGRAPDGEQRGHCWPWCAPRLAGAPPAARAAHRDRRVGRPAGRNSPQRKPLRPGRPARRADSRGRVRPAPPRTCSTWSSRPRTSGRHPGRSRLATRPGGAGVQQGPRRRAPGVVGVLEFAATEVVPRLARTTDEVTHLLRALDGRYVPAGPSGSPTRGLVNVLPTGRNFYSVDPKAIPSRNAWATGSALAGSLLDRHLADTGELSARGGADGLGHVGHAHPGRRHRRGARADRLRARLGRCLPAGHRLRGGSGAEMGRPRIDVTVRISGFFRDAFPHVIALLDDAISAVAGLDEPAESNYLRAHADEELARHGDRRRATTRIFGSRPGGYGAGLLPLMDARNWRTDADLAEVYAVWGGYAYGRGLDGRAARADMESSFRRIAVAAKNTDTREHDIVDSDDYFQFHGGMVAMVRPLTGRAPAAYIGDSAVPDQVETRTLAQETRRVFRSRVVNPRWIAAMQRHGYKGAFELAATVDYLFGYDATAGVVEDWMYDQLAQSYVFDPGTARSCGSRTRGRCGGSPSGCWRRPTAACGKPPTPRP